MTYRELRVRFAGSSYWEDIAIDEMHIEVVKRTESPSVCSVYDIDGCPLFDVYMPYDELVAKLNGEEWDAKQPPEPVVVSRWAWVDRCGNIVCTGLEGEVKECVYRAGGHVVELKGAYTP